MSLPWREERQAVKISNGSVGVARVAARWQTVRCWWPFVVLCLLGSSRWLISDRWTDSATTLVSSSAGCGMAALLTLGIGWLRWFRSDDRVGSASTPGRSALSGVLLLGGPLMALVLLPRDLDSSTQMISLALTPVVAGVACAALGEEIESVAGFIWPGLVALAGLLLVLPQPTFADPVADFVMLLGPVMTGVGAALLGYKKPEETTTSGERANAVMALSAAALFFGAAAIARGGLSSFREGFSSGAALLDAAMAWLAVACVQRIGAMRFTAVYALVPLVVLVEGLVLLRPPINTRTELGLALVLLAGVVLMVRDGKDEPVEGEGLDLS